MIKTTKKKQKAMVIDVSETMEFYAKIVFVNVQLLDQHSSY
jgi:hypothetical protein